MNAAESSKPRIVIVGRGFAGVLAKGRHVDLCTRRLRELRARRLRAAVAADCASRELATVAPDPPSAGVVR
jgi:hypothetical protein